MGILGGADGGILKALEFLEGAVVVAVDGIDAALETVEYLVAKKEDPAFGMVIR